MAQLSCKYVYIIKHSRFIFNRMLLDILIGT